MQSSPPGWHYIFLVGNPLTVFICHWHPGGGRSNSYLIVAKVLMFLLCFLCRCKGCVKTSISNKIPPSILPFLKTTFFVQSAFYIVLYKNPFFLVNRASETEATWEQIDKKNLGIHKKSLYEYSRNNFYQKCIQRCSNSRKSGWTPGHISTGKPHHHLQV